MLTHQHDGRKRGVILVRLTAFEIINLRRLDYGGHIFNSARRLRAPEPRAGITIAAPRRGQRALSKHCNEYLMTKINLGPRSFIIINVFVSKR